MKACFIKGNCSMHLTHLLWTCFLKCYKFSNVLGVRVGVFHAVPSRASQLFLEIQVVSDGWSNCPSARVTLEHTGACHGLTYKVEQEQKNKTKSVTWTGAGFSDFGHTRKLDFPWLKQSRVVFLWQTVEVDLGAMQVEHQHVSFLSYNTYIERMRRSIVLLLHCR